MIQDPTNQYIATILSQCDISGRELLEIGCGKGRITRDLAKYAKRVVATDPDSSALEKAQTMVAERNVAFLQAATGVPDLPSCSFDVAMYTLSLHHVPADGMSTSLVATSKLLKNNGAIVVIEPGNGGSFTAAKQRFGAGSGDELSAREAAIRAMHALAGWSVGETVLFRTLFQFDNDEDFLTSMLPDYQRQPDAFVADVRKFLSQHRTGSGIMLDAERRLNVLKPSRLNE